MVEEFVVFVDVVEGMVRFVLVDNVGFVSADFSSIEGWRIP